MQPDWWLKPLVSSLGMYLLGIRPESQSKPGTKMVHPEPSTGSRRRPRLFMRGIGPYEPSSARVLGTWLTWFHGNPSLAWGCAMAGPSKPRGSGAWPKRAAGFPRSFRTLGRILPRDVRTEYLLIQRMGFPFIVLGCYDFNFLIQLMGFPN